MIGSLSSNSGSTAGGASLVIQGSNFFNVSAISFGGTFASDTFETGSAAAAWGGTTTIVDMAVQRYGENVHDGLAEWHRKAGGNCAVDYAFHEIVGGVDEEGNSLDVPDAVLAEIAAMHAKLDTLELVLDSDPRRVTKTGVMQADPALTST